MQAQQQRHETLQHQLPQGTSEPQAEAAAAFPHQRPQEPYRRGADGVPGLRGRARSGGARGGGSQEGCCLGVRSGGPEQGLGEPGGRACAWQVWAREPGGVGYRSHHPAAAPGAAPAGCSGAARVPVAAAGPSAARPAQHPRAARRPRPVRPGARAAAHSRAAPVGAGVVGGGRGRPLADPAGSRPVPRPAQPLTFRWLSARWPRPSRPSQRTVGSGSRCQACSRSRTRSSRRSRAVGPLCSS